MRYAMNLTFVSQPRPVRQLMTMYIEPNKVQWMIPGHRIDQRVVMDFRSKYSSIGLVKSVVKNIHMEM